jgi:bifunctional non-homologous end joining protein LigD
VRRFVGWVADLVHAADPGTTTMEWDIPKRAGKVFLDVNMNREGANIASAYSVRPEQGATVSTPFYWDELDRIQPDHYTMATMFARTSAVDDPFTPVATGPGHSLASALQTLEGQVPKSSKRR